MYGSRSNRDFGSRNREFRTTAPVKVGEELEVTVESVGAKGDGIVKKDGFVIFVPGVKEGDRVRIRITKVLSKVGFGEVVGGEGSSAPAEDESYEEQPEAEEPAQEEQSSDDSETFGEEE